MKILQINSVHYRRGGADVVYLNTGRLLKSKGHDVAYFSQINSNNEPVSTPEFFINNVDYFSSSITERILNVPRFFYSKESSKKIELLIKQFKPDIAHIHLYKADLTPSILSILKNNKIPTVVSLHDYGFLCPHNLMLDGKMNICQKCLNGSALNCIANKCNRNSLILSTLSSFEYIFEKTFFPFDKTFNTLIAVSNFIKNKHQESKRFNWTIKQLYNFFPDLDTTSSEANKGSYMLFFGRLSKEKGIETLLHAWKRLSINAKLKIVGTGPLLEELKKMASPNIDFLGFKSGSELQDLVKNSSFVIVPSEWYENNPLTIIEAYAYGKPVVGSKIGGIPEIIEEGKTGFLFKPGDTNDLHSKLVYANSTSNAEYSILSRNARQFANDNFHPEVHYLKLIEIYNETISNY